MLNHLISLALAGTYAILLLLLRLSFLLDADQGPYTPAVRILTRVQHYVMVGKANV